ncbi:hypothetical protein [Hymenobacter sp. IS2118]|uniref:hypothetical protein n=1 Tax=Hymenobacter sp. IS2118 TaxID=1505605 RepID=UPI00054DE60C|nr:hypothetical protein [Hymenobacter sp. IS2118]
MKLKRPALLLTAGLLLRLGITTLAWAGPPDNLRACWNQQAKPMQTQYVSFPYRETLAKLEHSFQPWQQTAYTGAGRVWTNATGFAKSDTLRKGAATYFSQTQFTGATLLFQDYGDKELSSVTTAAFQEYAVQAARYAPGLLIQHFYGRHIAPDPESTPALTVYKATVNRVLVRLFIRTADNQLSKVTSLHHDELFGDVTTTYSYRDYARLGKLVYPRTIVIESINGKLTDTVTIGAAAVAATAPVLLTAPAGYALAPETAAKPETTVEQFRPRLHLLNLKHTDDRVLVVEFDTFLLVAEAPLNSENGELIIGAARRIAPGKPIRYFVAGHYHPHYLGGVRPFVHKGATVLTTAADLPYVQYLAAAPHTLQPDSLQRQPRPLRTEEIVNRKTIAEGAFRMEIYVIGSQSQHTNDYLIYYFPTEKILFQDDLVWIAKQGEPRKASARQAGLYHAVLALGLDVQTIVQSWPVRDYGVKTIIPFSELQESMSVK